ncbi:porin [Sutterella parvirubra]|uniref:Outer membrane insertion signal domain protein n=1 Tax=Sutterella parvirubra YIT 11816 TaxID=762967 RepID=H3KDI0_9BURK|nr:porin [Sutterella parvirubra]EHY31841.1 outer membrane insertion signal domain protein [Sutterella parvirubra YIT 11816]
MFKKTLAGLAVAGLFSGAAMAADVNVYGVVDLGLMYNHTKSEAGTTADAITTTKDDSLTMESGMNAGSRFGLRGSEDLGNGMTVSFKLENGFSADSGKLSHDGRLFGREASLTLAGAFGQVSFGRMGGVASAAGTYDYVYAIGDAFDGFDNGIGGLVTSSRYDNMITYQTPEFAGMKVLAQYSFKNNTVANDDDKALGDEGKTSANRYASLAAVGQYGNLNLVAAYELQNVRHVQATPATEPNDDQHTFYVGANYDFGVTKLFGMGQVFQGVRSLNGIDALSTDGIDGFGLTVGAQTPVAGGLLTTSVYYANGDDSLHAESRESTYYGLAARYEYSLSKRTTAYAGAGYAKQEAEFNKTSNTLVDYQLDKDLVQAYVGLKHTF